MAFFVLFWMSVFEGSYWFFGSLLSGVFYFMWVEVALFGFSGMG